MTPTFFAKQSDFRNWLEKTIKKKQSCQLDKIWSAVNIQKSEVLTKQGLNEKNIK